MTRNYGKWCALILILLAAAGSPADDLDIKDELEGGIYARLDTLQGKILIRLDTAKTSQTTTNFIELAEGKKEFTDPQSKQPVTRPFYENTLIFRVSGGRFIQGGCPLGDGSGGPGYNLKDESVASSEVRAGAIAMFAKDGEVNGSQFILACDDLDYLNGKFPVFGQTVYGSKVISTISQEPVSHQGRPVNPPVISHVEIIRVSDDEPLKVINALNYGAKVTVHISTPPTHDDTVMNTETLARNRAIAAEKRRIGGIYRMTAEDYLGTPAETWIPPETRRQLKEERWKREMQEELRLLNPESGF